MNKKKRSSPKMLRLLKSDRWIHWSIAVPCIVCYVTSLILIIVYNPNPDRPFRDVFSWIHRISGASLVVLPTIAMFKSKHDLRSYVQNINQAWAWTIKDIKCLCFLMLSYISRKAIMPNNDRLGTSVVKFNYAAALMLMSTYPFFIITGTLIWITNGLLIFWLVHFLFAMMATLFLLIHVFMSILDPPSRVALSKRISNFVDRLYIKNDQGKD